MLYAVCRAYRSLGLLGTLFLVSFASPFLTPQPVEGQLSPLQGYQPRGCGFDLDDDGLLGEPVDDCRICNGLDSDPDGDGVDEDLIYVDCDNGTDDPSCGSPGNPCGSLSYALVTHPDGPADGAEDIICVRGTCSPSNIKPTTRGIPGHRVAPATGSDENSFEYPTNPAMIVGWDTDADGQYPPFDNDDHAVLDGSGLGRAFHLNFSKDNSYFEIAHLEVRDYNSTGGGNGGFMKMNQGNDATHTYVHDLELENIGANGPTGSGAIVFDHFASTNLRHLAIENLESKNQGGYFVRGSPGDGPGTAGNLRYKNLTIQQHGGCGSGCSEKNNRSILFRIWGYFDNIEILDSVFDANMSAVPAGYTDPGAGGIMLLHCLQDVTIRNNSFRDYKGALTIDTNEWGCDLIPRGTDDVKFDRNTVVATRAMNQPFGGAGVLVFQNGAPPKTLVDLDVTNNFFSGPDGGLASCFHYVGGNPSAPQPGRIQLINNTCHGDLFLTRGAFQIAPATPHNHERWTVENNVIGGLGANDWAVRLSYNPLQWSSRSNSFSPGAGFSWNNSSRLDLASFKQQSQSENGSDSCEASFENPAASDLHLLDTDTCAKDKGVATIASGDIDGQARGGGDPWDRGADEAGAPAGPGGGQTLLQIVAPADDECVSQSSVQVTGYADAASGVSSVMVNGVAATLSPAGTAQSQTRMSFQHLTPLQAGANQIALIMNAGDGSSMNGQRRVYRDLGDPHLSFSSTISPSDPNLGLIQGTVDDESGIQSVSVNGTIVSLQSSFSGGQSFSHSIPLQQGNNSITVTVTDLCQNTTQQSDQIDVSSNSGPTVTPQTVHTTEEQAVAILLSGTDPDGDRLTFEIVSPPTSGTLSGVAPALSYQPNPNFSGTDQLRFRATDGQSYSSTVAVTIQVANVNDTPVARNDAYVAVSGAPLSVPAPGVLANDGDVDGDNLTVALAQTPQKGNVNLAADGSFTYTPSASSTGSDQFSYRVSDGKGGVATGQVSITIQGTQSGDVKVSLGIDMFLIDQQALVRKGTFSSRGGSATATVDYGDGSGLKALKLHGPNFTLQHQYSSPGVYLIQVCVTTTVGSGCGSVRAFQKLSTQLTLNTSAVEVSSGLLVEATLRDSQGRAVTSAPLRLTSSVGCNATATTNASGVARIGCPGAVSGGGQVSLQVYYDAKDRDTLAPTSASSIINVVPDAVVIEGSRANVMHIETAEEAYRSDRVDFVMMIRERLDGGSETGNLERVTVQAETVPLSNGSKAKTTCSRRFSGSGLNLVLTATCAFDKLKPDVYFLKTTVSGPLSGVHYESFAVARPAWDLATGAGSFIWPDTANPTTGYPGDRATFAFTRAPSGNVQGNPPKTNVVVVRNYEDGTSSRMQSLSIDYAESATNNGARIVEIGGPGLFWERASVHSRTGWFSFHGVDRSTDGSRDQMWVEVMESQTKSFAPLAFRSPKTNHFEQLQDGDVEVP